MRECLAIGYATARAKFGRGEISVYNRDGSIHRTIPFDRSGDKLCRPQSCAADYLRPLLNFAARGLFLLWGRDSEIVAGLTLSEKQRQQAD